MLFMQSTSRKDQNPSYSYRSSSSLSNLSKPFKKLSTFSEAIDYFKRNLIRLETQSKKPQVQIKDPPIKKRQVNYSKLTLSLSPTNQLITQSQGTIFSTFQSKVCTPQVKSPKKLSTIPLNKGVLANKIQFSANPRGKVSVNLKTSRSGRIQIPSRNNEEGKRSHRKSIMISKETLFDDSESSLSIKMDPVFVNNCINEYKSEERVKG